jgi:hypothetical protein
MSLIKETQKSDFIDYEKIQFSRFELMAQTMAKLEFLRELREICILADLYNEAKMVDQIMSEIIFAFGSRN